MFLSKIHRHGRDSNVITIPKEFERIGFRRGEKTIITELPGGDLLLTLAKKEEANITDDHKYR